MNFLYLSLLIAIQLSITMAQLNDVEVIDTEPIVTPKVTETQTEEIITTTKITTKSSSITEETDPITVTQETVSDPITVTKEPKKPIDVLNEYVWPSVA